MFKHYIVLFFRTIKRYKTVFSINLIGLSTGLAATLLITLWIMDELKVDRFYENGERLYQVLEHTPLASGIETDIYTPGKLASTLIEEMPEVEAATSVIPASWFESGKGVVSSADLHLKVSGQFVDKNYFKVFPWKIIKGNSNAPLNSAQDILVSRELALKLFKSIENSMGKTISWDHEGFAGIYTISGVFEAPPKNSTIQFDILFNYGLFEKEYADNLENWGNSNPSTFVLLKEETDAEAFNDKIKNLAIQKYQETRGTKYLEYVSALSIQRVSDRYLYNRFENGVQAGGRISYVKLFSIIALFLLLIAAINFINLSTAVASKRMKEIGIKKAVGAQRKSIMLQFMGEAIATSFLSTLLALLLVALLLPQFNEIIGKQLQLSFSLEFVMVIIGIALVTGLLSGSYPAFYLAKLKSIKVLKGILASSKEEVFTRKGLVIFQFATSIVLIVAVLIVHKQIEYTQGKNLGYVKDNIISFKQEGSLNTQLRPFLKEVQDLPGVLSASSFAHDLIGNHGGTSGLSWEGKKPKERIEFGNLEVDYGLMELLQMELLSGRTFSEDFGTDEKDENIIFNEAAIAAMGLENPIGKTIKLWGKERHIIGVVKNFHFESLYEKVGPCMIRYTGEGQNILVKIQANKEKEVLAQLQKIYSSFTDGISFDFTFLDEDYQQLYSAEQRVSTLSKYFAGLAILISCLGLFGLAIYTAERRRKEISIRKVMGQSVSQIIVMLSHEFAKLVLLSILIGLPIAYILTDNWLVGFAYKIPLNAGYFIGAGLVALMIALLTVGGQAVTAANKNPIHALREE